MGGWRAVVKPGALDSLIEIFTERWTKTPGRHDTSSLRNRGANGWLFWMVKHFSEYSMRRILFKIFAYYRKFNAETPFFSLFLFATTAFECSSATKSRFSLSLPCIQFQRCELLPLSPFQIHSTPNNMQGRREEAR